MISPSEDNPLMKGLAQVSGAEPCIMVIFGATGDLTHRKLIGAIYNLAVENLLPEAFAVVGFARREKDDQAFATEMRNSLDEHSRRQPIDETVWKRLAPHIHYHCGSFGDSDAYATLAKRLDELDNGLNARGNRLFYFATPPEHFPTIVDGLSSAKMIAPANDRSRWTRVIVEKPFGHDLDSARKLDQTLHGELAESQIYRIDHYLGKETVQNILVFRLGNGFFEPLWNSRYVDHVQITVAESVGVEGRAAYYEKAGVVRDMLQSHILQLLTLLAMEPPVTLGADAIRDEKVKVLRSLRAFAPADVRRHTVRGQYAAGLIGGTPVEGYRDEPGVDPASMVDTYTALEISIDNWRWAGTPFYVRVGKRLPRRSTEVAITFKAPPLALFAKAGVAHSGPNVLGIRIQPNEGIYLAFSAKAPGQKMHIDSVRMDFQYATSFGVSSPEAYERLILDAITGDATLFARTDEVDLSWEWIDRILNVWHGEGGVPLVFYPAGSEGPNAADLLLQRDGRRWRSI